MKGNATGMKSSQVTLKLTPGGGLAAGATLKAAANVTLKLPPSSQSARVSSGMTMNPYQAPIESVWDQPKEPMEHDRKMAALVAGLDRMSSAFEDATRTKQDKRLMMDDMHETALERIEATRQDMEETITELAAYLDSFYLEHEQALRTFMEGLSTDRQKRVASIAERFLRLEQRYEALQVALDAERENRLRDTELTIGPARRAVEVLATQLDKEQRIRRNRNNEIRQQLEDAFKALSESLDVERRSREVRFKALVEDAEREVARLGKREGAVVKENAQCIADVQADVDHEQELRVKSQDDIVEKITDFIQRFQAHIVEEGHMGC